MIELRNIESVEKVGQTKRAIEYAIAGGESVAKDLFRHSTKKWEDETNILPHFCSTSPLKPAFLTSNNIALRRTELGGCKGAKSAPCKKLSPHIGNRAFLKNNFIISPQREHREAKKVFPSLTNQ